MITISFGQALLLLINKYKDDNITCFALKQYYIQGINSSTDLDYIEQLFHKSHLIEKYNISYTENTIDDDASRRYFETHLAFETLTNSIDKLKIDDLYNYFESLYSSLPRENQNKFNGFMEGKISPREDNFATEYIDAFQKVRTHESYSSLSTIQKEKLILLLKSSWLGVLHGNNPKIPLNIYGTGFFSEQNRGRINKQNNVTPTSKNASERLPYCSKHFGLMKNYMPVPRNDIIYAESGFTFIKPSDQNTFNPQSQWAKKNFSKLVHPFSCSISGTTLCQLRCMKKLESDNQLVFNSLETFTTFLKCFTSGLLFNSGGHVYNEFLSVLEIPEIKNNFAFIVGFEEINATTLLLNGNEEAFNKALDDTLTYTKALLAKKELNHELLSCHSKTDIQRYN